MLNYQRVLFSKKGHHVYVRQNLALAMVTLVRKLPWGLVIACHGNHEYRYLIPVKMDDHPPI